MVSDGFRGSMAHDGTGTPTCLRQMFFHTLIDQSDELPGSRIPTASALTQAGVKTRGPNLHTGAPPSPHTERERC